MFEDEWDAFEEALGSLRVASNVTKYMDKGASGAESAKLVRCSSVTSQHDKGCLGACTCLGGNPVKHSQFRR